MPPDLHPLMVKQSPFVETLQVVVPDWWSQVVYPTATLGNIPVSCPACLSIDPSPRIKLEFELRSDPRVSLVCAIPMITVYDTGPEQSSIVAGIHLRLNP